MANIVAFDPFAEMRALQKQFFGDDVFNTGHSTLALPTTDVYTEDDKRLVVEAHLPHFSDNDISVTTDRGFLEIQAEKHDKVEDDKKRKYVVRESSSSFYRRIKLPDQSDEEHIEAHINNGILKVIVPFKSLPEPKHIAITASAKNK